MVNKVEQRWHDEKQIERVEYRIGKLSFFVLGCTCYKLVKFERIKFLVVAVRNGIDIFAWAPKPYARFMLYKRFEALVNRPMIVDLTVEEGTKLKGTLIG